MIATLSASGIAAECQKDTFKTKGGKEVAITAIKHASLRIQYVAYGIVVIRIAHNACKGDVES